MLGLQMNEELVTKIRGTIRQATITKSSGVIMGIFTESQDKATMRQLLQSEVFWLQKQGLSEKEVSPKLMLDNLLLALAMRY